MGLLVEDLALSGEVVFGPELLVMNEGALARAEKQVLQRRDRKQVDLGVEHGGQLWIMDGLGPAENPIQSIESRFCDEG